MEERPPVNPCASREWEANRRAGVVLVTGFSNSRSSVNKSWSRWTYNRSLL